MRRLMCIVLCLSFLALPVSGEESPGYLALTFDDGPSGRFTRQLLDGLQQRGVQATFFLCGYRIREYPQEAQRIIRDGHEVGCHGFSHNNMQYMSRREVAAEIKDMQAMLPEGTRIRFLRPPGGCCSDNVRQVAEAMNLAILSWSVDPKDWATKDAAAVERTVLRQVKDGDIILLHDMTESSVNAALDIIDRLMDQGYRFVTVSDLAAYRRARIRAGKTYCAFPPSANQLKNVCHCIPMTDIFV